MDRLQWSALDIVFVVIIAASTGFALTKGLAREIVSIVALVGGFFSAVFLYPVASAWFADIASTETVADFLGFMVIFVGFLMAGAAIAWIINRLIKVASLEWIDRLLGGIFGLLRGWAIGSVIVLALIAFPIRHEAISKSILAPYLLAGARTAVLLVPQDLKAKFHEQYRKVLQAWNQNRSTV